MEITLYNGKYKITSDELNSILKVKTNKFEKKKDSDGKVTDEFTDIPIYDTLGYFSNLQGAFKFLYTYILKAETSGFKINNEKDILKIISTIKEQNVILQEEIRKVV